MTEEEVEGFAGGGGVGAEALEIVIEVGDVGEKQVWGQVRHAENGTGGIHDPVAGFVVG